MFESGDGNFEDVLSWEETNDLPGRRVCLGVGGNDGGIEKEHWPETD